MTRCVLDDARWQALHQTFGLIRADEGAPERYQPAHRLMTPDGCRAVLDALMPVLGAPSRRVAASLLSKRLAFLVTGAAFFSFSAQDRVLDLSPDNVLLDYRHDGRRWRSGLPLREVEVTAVVARAKQRELLARQVFAALLRPLWQTCVEVSRVSPRILWENTAVRLYSLYDRRLAQLDAPTVRARSTQDFTWLLAAPPEVFGLDYNPLAHFRRAAVPNDMGNAARFRRTCCLYYQASQPVEYCQNCPLIRPRRV